MHRKSDRKEDHNRAAGAIWGLFIGDALAMPVHWYYDRGALHRDYGRVADYTDPKHPHPDSILWRSSYTVSDPRFDILHDQARYWGQPGIHYHRNLRAGDNTLTAELCRLLMSVLADNTGYDPDDYLARYITFMTTPGRHRDTYVEECHRHFFANLAAGKPPHRCGVTEKHIGGLAGVVPIVAFYRNDPSTARAAALNHLSLTHPGARMAAAAEAFIDTLLRVLAGEPLAAVIDAQIRRQANPHFGHPFHRWMEMPDEVVVGRILSTACYVEDAVPAVFYLARKYATDPERGLIVNTNLGGDNVHRGAVLGALLGARNGPSGFPDRWIEGLSRQAPDQP